MALRLAHKGHQVNIFEQTDQVGGRNRSIKVGEAEFDAGPTLMMMLDPFRKLFRDVGESIESHLELHLCDPSYRVFYPDGTRIEGSPNMARMLDQIEKLAGIEEASRYPAFIGRLGELYHGSVPHFVRNNFFTPWSFLAPAQLGRVLRHKMLANLYKQVAGTFKDERLRQLFSFQTMYLGLSPYESPFVYATLTYMEYGEGIWYPKGGIHEIAKSIARLAEARGATIRLSTKVAKVEQGGVTLEDGTLVTADAVIVNADLPSAERTILGKERGKNLLGKERLSSCSAYMMYFDYDGELPQLLHHNVFFGAAFKENLDDIFTRHRVPKDPAFYAAISKRTDPSKAPQGRENLYILVPCPNLDCPWTEEGRQSLRRSVLSRLEREVGLDLSKVRAESEFTPVDWQEVLGLDKGAAFGISHHFIQSAFFRPGNKSKKYPGTYFLGASTAPGNGMPMVLIGAELLEERLQRDGLI